MTNMSTPSRPSRWRWFALTPIVFGVVVLAVQLITSTSSGAAPGGDREGADRVCRERVLAKLRAPGTARFSGGTVSFLPGETAEFYTARGQVDAQNGFGALLRVSYQCDLTRERNSFWQVTSVVVG